MITMEELELLDESTKQKILQELNEANQLKSELTGIVQKAYTNPEAKRKLEDALKTIDPNIVLPPNPAESYIEPLKQELEELKRQQAIESLKNRVQAKARELGISPDEGRDVERFMNDNHILDYEKALELYAIYKQSEQTISSSTVQGDILSDIYKSQEIPKTLDEAKDLAIKHLAQMKLVR